MGYQLVGPKKLRRFSTLCGVPLVRVYGGGSYTVWFPAEAIDGRNLWVNAKTGAVEFLTDGARWDSNPDEARAQAERQATAEAVAIARFGSLEEAARVAAEYREGAKA